MSVENMITDRFIDGLYRDARVARDEGWLDDWYKFYSAREEIIVPGVLDCVERIFLDLKRESRSN